MRALHVIGVALLATFAPPAIALTPPPESTITALSNLGQPVMGALAGDVDGDGFGDVILGSMAFEDGEFFEGALFFYYGGPGGIASGDLDSADTTVQSNAALAGLGRNVAAAGDLDGDGYDDVLATGRSASPTNDARVHVYHGSATGIVTTAATTLTTLQDDSLFGFYERQLAAAGDVNGDNYDDVAISASAYAVSGAPVGAVYVYHGSATGIGTVPSTTLLGDATSGIGNYVATGGDVNGDGYDDLLISSDLAEARVYHGSAAGIPSGSPATADATLTCPPTILGVPLSEIGGIGDVNGDGYDDVAVGCASYDDAGRAMVFLGGATGISDGGSEAADWVLRGVDQEIGNAEAEFFGTDIAGADLNGDGFSDFIVSDFGYAPEGDPNDLGIDSGLILVLFGGSAGLTPEVAERTLRIEGPIAWEQLAGTTRRGVDVNGDGLDDLFALEMLGTDGKFHLFYGESIGSLVPALGGAGALALVLGLGALALRRLRTRAGF